MHARVMLFTCAALILGLWLVASDRVAAETGWLGGMAGFNGCMEGCQEDGTNDKLCRSYCDCALTIESTRWREELIRSEIRAKACAAKVFDGINSPAASPLKLPGAQPGGHNPVSNREVLLCTPMYTDSRGAFLPEHKKAIDDGTMKKHWQEVDVLFNRLKKENIVLRTAQSGNTVRFLVADYRKSMKVDSIESLSANSARCPDHYRSERYEYDVWMNNPGMRPKGVKSL